MLLSRESLQTIVSSRKMAMVGYAPAGGRLSADPRWPVGGWVGGWGFTATQTYAHRPHRRRGGAMDAAFLSPAPPGPLASNTPALACSWMVPWPDSCVAGGSRGADCRLPGPSPPPPPPPRFQAAGSLLPAQQGEKERRTDGRRGGKKKMKDNGFPGMPGAAGSYNSCGPDANGAHLHTLTPQPDLTGTASV